MSSLRQLRNISTEGLQFRLVDAQAQVVGRLAAQLSLLLQGKDKPHWSPWGDVGDVVVVKNTAHVDFTGKKWTNKLYRWHTGYPGGLKQRSARSQHGMDPTSVLWKAVNGMLPKNKLRQGRMAKLLLFPGQELDLPESVQLVPWQAPPRKIRRSEGLFELPPDFEPLNVQGYTQRFGHLLPSHQRAQMQRLALSACIPQRTRT